MLAKLKKILPQNAFARSVSVLVGGTAGAQALMVLAAPLLTRLYTPENFGLLAVYAGLLALLSVAASLRYELAIPLPENQLEAANVLVLSLLVVLLMTGTSSLMVLLAGEQIAQALNAPKLIKYFWLLPVGVFLSGVYKVFNYWAVRTKAFSDISRTRVSQTLATLAIQLLGFKLGEVALLFGQASGQGVGSLRLAASALKCEEFKSCSWRGVLQAAKRYKQFPLFSTWSGLLNTAGTQLPPILFAALFNTSSAGLYALANRILKLPITVLGSAIGQVFFSDLAKAQRESMLTLLVGKGVLNLVKLSFPAAAIFMLVAPDLFLIVFGEKWQISGEVARWMTPWLLLQFISSPISSVYFVLERERLGLCFQIVMFSLRAASVLVGFVYFDFMGTLIIFSLVSAACYFIYIISILLLAHVRVGRFLASFFKELALVSVAILPLAYFYSVNLHILLYFGLLVFLAVFYVPRLQSLYK